MHLMPRPAKKTDSAPPVQFDRLTQAEYRILKLLDLGFSNQEIAERLDITVGTAKWHMHPVREAAGKEPRQGAGPGSRPGACVSGDPNFR